MKQILASLLLVLLAIGAKPIYSQPVLNKEDILPNIGEVYYFSLTNEPDTIHKV